MSQWGRNGILGDDWGPMGEEKEGRDLGVPHSTWQPLFGSGAGCACADLMPWGSRSLLVSLEGWFILVSLSPPHPPSLNQTSSCSSKSASSCLLAGNGAVSEHGPAVSSAGWMQFHPCPKFGRFLWPRQGGDRWLCQRNRFGRSLPCSGFFDCV